MPGFLINGQGGDQTSNVVEPRRTHRWMFTVVGRGVGAFSRQELLLLRSAARPKFKFDETKMDHNQEEVFFAGKQHWEPIEMTWYDIEQPDISRGIYKWLGSTVNIPDVKVAHPANYKRTASLQMLNGQGLPNETWNLYGAWGKDFDWKGLDYTQSEIQLVSVQMRYDRAVRDCAVLAPAPYVSSMCE